MGNKKVKAYLSQLYWLSRNVNTRIEEIERLRSLAEKCTTSITGMPGSRSEQDKLSRVVAQIVDKLASLSDDVRQELELMDEITATIASVQSSKHRAILEMRYIAFKSWSDIAAELGYDTRYVFKLHTEALSEIENLGKNKS